MTTFSFTDALTNANIEFDYSTGAMTYENSDSPIKECKSLLFPGCSFINYGMPLVESVYDLLKKAGAVNGISFLCCGKILSYEPNGTVLRDSFEEELREHMVDAGVKRIVIACPNCVKAIRDAFSLDPRTKEIELAILPQVFFDLGYKLDPEIINRLICPGSDKDALLAVHDSCPDREYGEFADALRKLIPDGMWADPKHCRKKSVCCGSLPRAQGKIAQADKCADLNAEEAIDVKADAIITACFSCAFQLNFAQSKILTIHFLELLYDWRIDWQHVGTWMKYRFLFDDILGAEERQMSSREFVELSTPSSVDATQPAPTLVDESKAAGVANTDVAISNDDTLDIA